MLIISVLTPCGFDQMKKLYLVRWGLGLGRRSKVGESGFAFGFSQEEGNSKKNFDYSVLLACGLAYPGAGY
jgi:hypothetical protein